jgi:hypothetical protein
MSEIKTIDPRGLEHHDREALIFPSIEELGKEEWEQVKKECDKIGYCCFTPEDQIK